MSKLTEEQKIKIDLNYIKGKVGYRKVAEKLGLPPGQVRYYLENEWIGAPYYLPGLEDPAIFSESIRPLPKSVTEESLDSPFRAVVWDLETTGLRSDIGTLVVAAFLNPDTGIVESRTVHDFDGDEEKLAVWAVYKYSEADIIIGHNSVAFDKNFLNGVLARYGQSPLPPKIQADTYLIARYGFKGLLQSYSLENVADFFRLGKKDRPSKHDWRESIILNEEAIERIRVRCEEDVRLTAKVFNVLKPHWARWRGQ